MVVSPPLAGWVFDTRGSYHLIWLILGVVTIVGVIVILAVPPASIHKASDTESPNT